MSNFFRPCFNFLDIQSANNQTQGLQCDTSAPFRRTGSQQKTLPVSRMRCLTHETSLADPFVSKMRYFAHETTAEDHPVSRTRRLAHETTLADLFVSRSRRFAHETSLADLSVSRTRRLAHETTSELSCATGTLWELYGDSTGAPRCRRGETRASATHRETWCLSGR